MDRNGPTEFIPDIEESLTSSSVSVALGRGDETSTMVGGVRNSLHARRGEFSHELLSHVISLSVFRTCQVWHRLSAFQELGIFPMMR